MLLLESSATLFFGRFHPVFVHLPIGFLLLAVLMEFFNSRVRSKNMDAAILFALKLGTVSAFIAAAMGWFLANQGGYNESHLFWHRWLGIGVGVVSLIALGIKGEIISVPRSVYQGGLLGMTLMLIWTGHLGGNMTHGADYLTEYLPFLNKDEVAGTALLNDPDSVFVYQDLVKPLLEKRCFECHNEDKSNGDLRMHTTDLLVKGGDSGPVLVSGKAIDSELFKRITRDPTSKKFMPPGGKAHLGYKEVQLIGWWIDNGASFDATVATSEIPRNIKRILEEMGVSLVKKSFVEVASVEPAAASVIEELKTLGFNATPLASGNNFLDVRFNKLGATPGQSDLEKLLEAKEQVTWLNLASMNISDDMLEVVSQLPNLTRLQIQQNPISDQGIAALENLKQLETLNLYATQVTDAALVSVEKMPNLKKLFLWQTKVTQEGAEDLKTKRPKLDVDMGYSLTASKEEE